MKPRIKMHQMPGDIWKGEKIAMLEGRGPRKHLTKTFKSMLRMRERATLNRQAEKEIQDADRD